jgi:hypothetical protein
MTSAFAIRTIGGPARVTLILIILFDLLLGGLVWSLRGVHPVAMGFAAATCLGIAVLFLWFLIAQGRSRVEVSGDGVAIRIPMYGRVIGMDRIVPGSVRSVSVKDDAAYRLTWRTNGLGVPGYQLGWFTTAGVGKALAAISAPEVLGFQTRDGYAVLLSVADRDGLERALGNALAGSA